MSTHQQANPRRANQSITDESGRPGTLRSNVGCDAIDEPCTNSTTGFPEGESTNFSHRKRRTPSFNVQCATPSTGGWWTPTLAAAAATLPPEGALFASWDGPAPLTSTGMRSPALPIASVDMRAGI